MYEQMDKVRVARKHIQSMVKVKPLLQIDGGVSLDTIAEAAQAGANCFVAGSAVYKSSDPAQMVEQLRKLATENLLI